MSSGFLSTRLHRLVYTSHSRISVSQLRDEVTEIIDKSVANNSKVQVTGLLLVHLGRFVQALEGPHQAVMQTYGRILQDRRHDRCHVISAAPAEERVFAQWAMCSRELSAADAAISETLARRGPFEPAKLSTESALKLLTSVAQIKNRVHDSARAA